MVLNKHEIEAALYTEHQEISAGTLKEDNPLDLSDGFKLLCEACRKGDLKVCQENITEGVNINARDRFDYTPLILVSPTPQDQIATTVFKYDNDAQIANILIRKASLCGHFEVVQLLLESGALCERDTFQGERCLYNALNDRIRNLLLSYDYSKSRDPLQPLAAHVTSLLTLEIPQTSDITLVTHNKDFRLHKFLLSARSPYFAKKLNTAPETPSWRVPVSIPTASLEIAIKALYFQEVYADFGSPAEFEAILAGIEKLGRQLEIGNLFDTLLESDRRKARQRRTEEIERGRDQLEKWFQNSVLSNEMEIPSDQVENLKWDRQNSIFADVLICADGVSEEAAESGKSRDSIHTEKTKDTSGHLTPSIPIGPLAHSSRSPSRSRETSRHTSTVIPAHRAMLIRSDYFNAMFSSAFAEAQPMPHLPVVHLDCSPKVLQIILTYLYTEKADFGLDVAIEVLFAADLLFIEKLKVKAAVIISTLGNGTSTIVDSDNSRGGTDEGDLIDIYDVVRAGWDTRVHRLEEFGARYIANRLERYIDEEEFKELVRESAARIQQRQETDTVELIDDIRYYLSERFRLRFEDSGLDDIMDEEVEAQARAQAQTYEAIGFGNGIKDDTDVHGSQVDEGIDMSAPQHAGASPDVTGVIRTLDGEIAGDEFAQDALNYQILLGKIDTLLEGLKLDA